MNRFLQTLHHPRTRSSLLLLALCFILWFLGPYVAIAGHSVLASIDHRLIAILLLALAWKYNISWLRLKATFSAATTFPTVTPEVKALRQEVKAALAQFRHKKPGYLLFGPAKCGKSSLLQQQDPGLSAAPVANYKFGTGWSTAPAVFFELNTDFLLLDHWFKFAQRFRRLQSFDGCVFALNFTAFFNQSRQQQQADIQKYSSVIQQAVHYKPMPVFIVFTQCDLIAGFSEFFADLGPEERTQTLGIPTSAHPSLAHAFEVQYATMVKRLNERVIGRMHQEHTPEKRNRIKDFPLQFEIIRPHIAELMQQIHNISGARLMGCYFTSCAQSRDAPVDFLAKPIATAFNLRPLLHAPSPTMAPIKKFFNTDLLLEVIPQSAHCPTTRSSRKDRNLGIYALCILIFGAGGFYLYHSYQDNMLAVKSVQQALINAKSTDINVNDYAFLSKLTVLSAALEQMRHPHAMNLSALGVRKTLQLETAAQTAYQQILLAQFIPLLKQALETTIANANAQDPDDLYSALEAYLMLSQPSQRDPAFITRWFSNYWQKTLATKPIERTQLTQQLALALKQPFKITPNLQIVATARNTLNQIPLAQLSYSVLLERYDQPIEFFSPNYALKISDQYSIPSLYTAANFNAVYNDKIAKACQQVAQGNWVLGAKQSPTANKVVTDQLVDQVQMLYLTRYANAWATLLTKINMPSIKNIMEANATFNVLGGANSPLWQLLQTIYTNTAPNAAVPQFAQVSDQFQTLDGFIMSPSANALMHHLTDLKIYLAKINAQKDVNKAAFAASAQRMINEGQSDNERNDSLENLAQQIPNLPQPLQTWMSSITTASWQAMLAATQNYLNYVWSAAVLPQYNATINNRYPLFPQARADIALGDFSKFFSPDGTLSAFFNFYLKPFVDTDKVYWGWKKVDNQTLNIPQTTLEMFMRATLIQKMYFANGSDKPLVKFTLIPQELEPGVSDFNLNIGGQVINYQASQTTSAKLIWSLATANRVSLQFINNQGQPSAAMLQGPWAWFKLLGKANLEKTADPRLFNLTFDLNGNSVKYHLLANELVNPFIPGIIDAFRCPQQL